MSFQTHTPAEWTAFLSLGVGFHAACSMPYFLLVESESARDFDPRPALRRAIESGRVDPVLCAVANAKYDARRATAVARHVSRDAALTVAALLILTIPTGDRS